MGTVARAGSQFRAGYVYLTDFFSNSNRAMSPLRKRDMVKTSRIPASPVSTRLLLVERLRRRSMLTIMPFLPDSAQIAYAKNQKDHPEMAN